MKKSLAFIIVGILALFSLAACGEKSQQDVVDALQSKVDEMSGYRTNATMTLQTGSEPQSYDIEVWHSKKDYYRVELKSNKKEQSQIILRNDEGVFVLTPALNKSFRFQSEWPQNSSQAYLFESLVNDIVTDENATFEVQEDNYVFKTKTNYKNKNTLPQQEIVISKDSLQPVMVVVMDQDENPLVQVDFYDFTLDPEFDEGAFEMKRNMSGAQIDIPTMAQNSEKELMVLYPQQLPEGVSLVEEKEIATDNGIRSIQTYAGEEKSFTLYQEVASALPASTTVEVEGEPVDLGFSVGALTEESLSWTNDGIEYYLASNSLTKEEMVQVAQSVEGRGVK